MLGWTFRGEVDTGLGMVDVKVEKTDAWNGWGVVTSMKVTGNDGALRMRAQREGGHVQVVYSKTGEKTREARFRRTGILFGPKTLKSVL